MTGEDRPGEGAGDDWNAERWQRTRALFERALAVPPVQRDDLLRDSGEEAAILRAVERMLAADAAFSTDNPMPAVTLMDGWGEAVLEPGTRLGAYAIRDCLGSGGMGRVYRAERVDEVAQVVAIKCLRFDGHDTESHRRFLRERRILARLAHPGIARFLDSGTSDATGRPYVVLEFVDGVPLTRFARDHALGVRARLELLLQVMDAVAYAHAQLIVHRDLKPGNVLVTADGAARLLDFGIAKPLANSVDAHDPETAIEQRAFSLGHAAPEQLRGGTIGTACDVYALGVLLYELLADAPPLALQGLAYGEAERCVLEQFPPAPSTRFASTTVAPDGSDASAWARSLRGDLDNITLHALKKEPGERYPTVDAFAADLRRTLAREPISLRTSQRWYRARRFVARHRAPVALAAAFALALLGGSIALWRQAIALRIERDHALQQQQRAEAVTTLLTDAFEAADPSRNQGHELRARDVLDVAARRLQAQPAIDPLVKAVLLTTLADVQRTLGDPAFAATLARNAASLLDADGAPLALARAQRVRAQAALDSHDIADAGVAMDAAARAIAGAPADRTTDVERSRLDVVAAEFANTRGEPLEALDLAKAAYTRSQERLGNRDRATIAAGVQYAERLRALGRTEASFVIVGALLQSIDSPELDPTGLRLLLDSARMQRTLAKPADAEATALRAVRGAAALYGEDHRAHAMALDLLARIKGDLGRFDEADDTFRRSLTSLEKALGTRRHGLMAMALNNYANFLWTRRHLAEPAIVAAREAVAIAEQMYAADHVNLATLRTTLAEILLDNGKSAEAEQLLWSADHTWARFSDAPIKGSMRAFGQTLLARALHARGADAEARELIGLALAKLEPLGDDNDDLRAARAVARVLGAAPTNPPRDAAPAARR